MTPHLSAKLLKPASPRLHPDIVVDSDDDDMVYSPYYRTPHPTRSTSSKRRRSHQLTAEVRAEIVARVLDPAYSGRHRDNYSSRVFIDPNGDEHDPDYQIFPTIYPTRRQTTSGFFRRVPSEEDLTQDEEDDAASIIAWTRERAASPITPSSSACTPSPPPNPVSLFGDDEWDEKEWTKEVVVPVPPQKRRKSKATPTVYVPTTPPIHPIPSFDEPEPEFAPARHSSVQLVREDTIDNDETPSCGYVLRRQWASFALHTRLSAHRIARRARRVVSTPSTFPTRPPPARPMALQPEPPPYALGPIPQTNTAELCGLILYAVPLLLALMFYHLCLFELNELVTVIDAYDSLSVNAVSLRAPSLTTSVPLWLNLALFDLRSEPPYAQVRIPRPTEP
ncbi:hypothetical protein OPQ81_006244 [Rhizoctonia solani]|nr:hypothetical protein OPQ81_006244 [Rhizoctonia solani]